MNQKPLIFGAAGAGVMMFVTTIVAYKKGKKTANNAHAGDYGRGFSVGYVLGRETERNTSKKAKTSKTKGQSSHKEPNNK